MNKTRRVVEAIQRARLSIEGLSIGDALGNCFFSNSIRDENLASKSLPQGPWSWTDDTAMSLAILEILMKHGAIHQDELAQAFSRRYMSDTARAYGPAQHALLRSLYDGDDWRHRSLDLFKGMGSLGNGAAMRVAPVGAYFADDLDCVIEQARLSAEITHSHSEAVAGAIAVAVAAAWAWNWNQSGRKADKSDLFHTVLRSTPTSDTRSMIEVASTFSFSESASHVAFYVGNGSKITACDTVPFCLWIAARHLQDFPGAIWESISVNGDIDTNCAIIGGIVALSTGESGIPVEWRNRREELAISSIPDLT
jgi:ADP-ribosylglycohydrolase